ncbi:MAG: hypothetical protein JXB46_10145, partial [Candidatus Eisenbacteria bacterium]|nr:hypothetical protein [Candidatus Eisenbacteria bacterium]
MGGVRTGPRVVTISADGNPEHDFVHLKPPSDAPERKRELIARFAALDSFVFPEGAADSRPDLPLRLLLNDAVPAEFIGILEWWAGETEAAQASGSPAEQLGTAAVTPDRHGSQSTLQQPAVVSWRAKARGGRPDPRLDVRHVVRQAFEDSG